jgi:7-keto-8-aminopelargonate synthetase-like enzyme
MIDEAHSIGVLGKSGRGICEYFGIDPGRIDLIVGTMSKAFAACGGFITAKAPVIEWLRYTLPGFVYSVGMPPHLAVAVQSALSIIEREPHRVRQLQNVSRYFVDTALKHGFDVGSAVGAGVVPLKFKDAQTTMLASKALLDDGIYVPPIVQVGVPKDMPRLRFFLSSRHTKDEVDRVFEVLTRSRFLQETLARNSPQALEVLSCSSGRWRSMAAAENRDEDLVLVQPSRDS